MLNSAFQPTIIYRYPTELQRAKPGVIRSPKAGGLATVLLENQFLRSLAERTRQSFMEPSVPAAAEPDVFCFDFSTDEYGCLHFVPNGNNLQRFEQLKRIITSKEIDLSSIDPSSRDWRLMAYLALFRLTANPNIRIRSFKPNHSLKETREFIGYLLGAAGIFIAEALGRYFNNLLNLLNEQADSTEFSSVQVLILGFTDSFDKILSEFLELENFERPTRSPSSETEGVENSMAESFETIFENALKKLQLIDTNLESFKNSLVEKSKTAGLTIKELQPVKTQLGNLSVFVRALQNIFINGEFDPNSKDPMARLASDAYIIYTLERVVRLDKGGAVQSREDSNRKSLILTSYLLSLENQLNKKHAEDLITQILRARLSGPSVVENLKEAIRIGTETLLKAPITYMIENPNHSNNPVLKLDHSGSKMESNDQNDSSDIDTTEGISAYEAQLEFSAVVLNELRNSILNPETPEEYLWLLINLGITSSIYLHSYTDILRFRPELKSAFRNVEDINSLTRSMYRMQIEGLSLIATYLICGAKENDQLRGEVLSLIDLMRSFYISSNFPDLESFLGFLNHYLSDRSIDFLYILQLLYDDPLDTETESSDANELTSTGQGNGSRQDETSQTFDLKRHLLENVFAVIQLQARAHFPGSWNPSHSRPVLNSEIPRRFSGVEDVAQDDNKDAYNPTPIILLGLLQEYGRMRVGNVSEEVIDESRISARRFYQYLEHTIKANLSDILAPINSKRLELLVSKIDSVRRVFEIPLEDIVRCLQDSTITVHDDPSKLTRNHHVTVSIPFPDNPVTLKFTVPSRRSKQETGTFIKSQFEHLTLEMLGPAKELISIEDGVTSREAAQIAEKIPSDRIPRVKRIIQQIGYGKFIELHERLTDMMGEVLDDEDLASDPEVIDLLMQIFSAQIPDEITPIKVRDNVSYRVTRSSRSRAENESASIPISYSEFFKQIIADVRVLKALAEQSDQKHVVQLIKFFYRYGFSTSEALRVLHENPHLLYWRKFSPHQEFSARFTEEVELFFLWLNIVQPDEVRSVITSYPKILGPEINVYTVGVNSLRSYVSDLITKISGKQLPEDELDELVVEIVKQFKGLPLISIQDVDGKLDAISAELLKAELMQQQIVDPKQRALEKERTKLEILTFAPELIAYSGTIQRFGQILSIAIELRKANIIDSINPALLSRLNSFNPVILKVSFELFCEQVKESSMEPTSGNFLRFLAKLNDRVREAWGLQRREQINSHITRKLQEHNYEMLKAEITQLVKAQTQ